MTLYYIDCAEGGRVRCASKDTPVGALTAVPEGFSPDTQMDYRMENGVLVHDPLPEVPATNTEGERLAALEARTAVLNAMIQAVAGRGEFMEDCIAELAGVVYGG